MTSRRLVCVHLAALALIVVVTFFNALHTSFKMDDHDFFNDPKITNFNLIGYNWFPEPDRYLGLSRAMQESSYRPVTNSALALNYHFFGRHVQAYHVVMIVLFFVGCSMIYWFVALLSGDLFLAFLSAVLFAVHPINGLAVNYVVASAYSYQLIFAFLTMICFIKTYQEKNKMQMMFLSLAMFLISLGIHETSLILPVYLLIIAWYMNRDLMVNACLRVMPFFVVLAGYIFFRMNNASLKTGVLEKFYDFQMSFFEYAASFTKLVCWYLSQLVVPDGVVLMWSTQVVRGDWWLWFMVGLFLVSGIFWFIQRRGRSVESLAMMVLLTGFGPILGACLFRPATGLIMEPHWMFFSSAGFFILLAFILVRIIRRHLYFGLSLSFVLVIGLVNLSHIYNDIWDDDKTYGYYWLKQAPEFKTTNLYIAYSLMQDKRYDEARRLLWDAREGIFSDWQIYTNLGLMDFEEGQYDRAFENYRTALSFNSSSPEIYNNLALVYEHQGSIPDAVLANTKALELNRFFIEPRLNLARLALARKDYTTAAKMYRENLAIVPDDFRTLDLYFTMLADLGDSQQIQAFVEDLLLKCRDVSVLTNIANIAADKRLYVIALDLYMQVLRIDPNYEPVYVQSGVLLANLNEFDRAIDLWKKAGAINPKDENVRRLIDQAEMSREKQKAFPK